jgi:hypothetical protein
MSKLRQFVFVVEACASSNSDWNYIRKLIESDLFVPQGGCLLKSKVYLGGKGNYKKKEKQDEINTFILRYPRETIVLYFFDTDHAGHKEKKLNEQISTFCGSLKYAHEIVWFNKDIENVFLGHGVSDGDKPDTAQSFHDSQRLNLDGSHLYAMTRKYCLNNQESNILCILSQFIPISTKYSKAVNTFLKK